MDSYYRMEMAARRALSLNNEYGMGALINAGSIKSGDGLLVLVASLAPYYKSGSEEMLRSIDTIISNHLGLKDSDSVSRYEQEIVSATNALNAFLDEYIQ